MLYKPALIARPCWLKLPSLLAQLLSCWWSMWSNFRINIILIAACCTYGNTSSHLMPFKRLDEWLIFECIRSRRLKLEDEWKEMSPWKEVSLDCTELDQWLMLTKPFWFDISAAILKSPLHSNWNLSDPRVVFLVWGWMTLIIDTIVDKHYTIITCFAFCHVNLFSIQRLSQSFIYSNYVLRWIRTKSNRQQAFS